MEHRHIAKRFWKSEATAMQAAADQMSAYDDIINLSIGDTDFITDERITRGAMEDALAGHTKYTNPQGDPELIAEIRRYYDEEYGMALANDQVFVTTSSCMGMELVLMSILDPGDEVLIFSPYFTPYKQQIELAWGKAVEVPTYEEDGFAIRAQALRAALTPKTKAIILNNPCNPTGAACSMETYRLIADIAQQRDLVVIADEIYTSYMYTEKFVPLRALDGMAERTITLNSFSKNYMMTGWRIGYVVAEPVFTSTMKKINENMVYTAPSISQRAAIYALRLREEMKEHYITEYKKRVYYASDRINSIPKLSVRRPDGTFYLFMNIKKTGLSSAEFCSRLLEQAHVVMIPGNAFGSAGEGYVRIACTTGIAQLKTAFDRIEKMIF